jgi:SNF2 family DNA or RNA helicase
MLNELNLHNYQKHCVQHVIDNNKAGLFLEMGLGKTVTMLTAVNKLIYEYLDVEKVLIIAPKRIVESVWVSEIAKWDHLKHLKSSRVIGNREQRLSALKKKADIYLISRDNITWLIGQYACSMLPFDMLIIDESSSFKNHKSQRFKALKRVLDSFTRTVILTGTPRPNNLLDLWAQIYILDRGYRLGAYVSHFRNTFFKPGRAKGHVVYEYKPLKGAEEQVIDKISDICISMSAEDYLELPPKIDNYVRIEMPDKILERYKNFQKDLVLDMLDDDTEDISVANAVGLSNKLRQFSNGAVYDEDKDWHEVHDLKIEAMLEIIEFSSEPVIVAYAFQHDLYRIEAALSKVKNLKYRRMNGDKDVLDWNAKKIDVLILHPASAGHGLNLQQGGNVIVWFGLPWSSELYEQTNARVHRQGQKKRSFIHHLVCAGTIDYRIKGALTTKIKGQNALMVAIKAVIEQYK